MYAAYKYTIVTTLAIHKNSTLFIYITHWKIHPCPSLFSPIHLYHAHHWMNYDKSYSAYNIFPNQKYIDIDSRWKYCLPNEDEDPPTHHPGGGLTRAHLHGKCHAYTCQRHASACECHASTNAQPCPTCNTMPCSLPTLTTTFSKQHFNK